MMTEEERKQTRWELLILTLALGFLLYGCGLLSLESRDRVDACVSGACGTDAECEALCGGSY